MTNLTNLLIEIGKEIFQQVFQQEWLSANNITNAFIVAPRNIETINTFLTDLKIKPVFIEKNPSNYINSEMIQIFANIFLFGKILYSFLEEDAEKIRIIKRIYDNE